jgi:hypothetical protein
LGEFAVVKGYNLIRSVPKTKTEFSTMNYFYTKGTMIGICVSSDIAYFQYSNQNNDFGSFDYYVTDKRLNKLNGRFYFNIQVDKRFYFSLTTVKIVDPVFMNKTFTISASFAGSNQIASSIISVNDFNSKNILLI